MDSYIKVKTASQDAITEEVRSLSVTDSLSATPAGLVQLPLHKGTKRWAKLLSPNEPITITAGVYQEETQKWAEDVVLDGVIRDIRASSALAPNGFSVGTTLQVASWATFLEQENVAYWMFYGTIKGWSAAKYGILPDLLYSNPADAARGWLEQVAFKPALLNVGGSLQDHLTLDLSGIDAIGNYETNVSVAEGSIWSVLQGLTDAPLQQLYATTKNGKTNVIFRGAPYPHSDTLGDYDTLPLHDLSAHRAMSPQGQIGLGYSAANIRNFFLLYPTFSFANDFFPFAMLWVWANQDSIAKDSFSPLKVSTKLISQRKDANSSFPSGTIEAFSRGLNQRLAGQWNRQGEMLGGQVGFPMLPFVHPGELVKFYPVYDHSGKPLVAHVLGRSLTWNPEDGGRTTLTVERGLPEDIVMDASWYTQGLTPYQPVATAYAKGISGVRQSGYHAPPLTP